MSEKVDWRFILLYGAAWWMARADSYYPASISLLYSHFFFLEKRKNTQRETILCNKYNVINLKPLNVGCM